MRFISLNLDLEDAVILRQAIAGALDRRSSSSLSAVDDDYRALHAMASELDRLIDAPSPRRYNAVVNGGPMDPGSHLTVLQGGLSED
ncbi:MAG: hypothetical protein ACR2J8_08210 [Thermomicrobiales bacterium]